MRRRAATAQTDDLILLYKFYYRVTRQLLNGILQLRHGSCTEPLV
jgi:hypothetical protein